MFHDRWVEVVCSARMRNHRCPPVVGTIAVVMRRARELVSDVEPAVRRGNAIHRKAGSE